MATAIGAYATTANVKARLQISVTTFDTLIGRYCDQVNMQMESRMGRVVAPLSGTTFLFDGYDAIGGRKIWVPMGIRTISLLEVAPATSGTFTTVTAGTFFLRPLAQDLPTGWPFLQIVLSDLGSSFFMPGYANIRATGTFGWPAIPDDLIDCAETTAVRAYQARRTGQGDTVGNDDMGRAIISRILAAEWRDVLGYYSGQRWSR